MLKLKTSPSQKNCLDRYEGLPIGITEQDCRSAHHNYLAINWMLTVGGQGF